MIKGKMLPYDRLRVSKKNNPPPMMPATIHSPEFDLRIDSTLFLIFPHREKGKLRNKVESFYISGHFQTMVIWVVAHPMRQI